MDKINTYESYLKDSANDGLPVEEALEIYSSLADSVEKCTLADKMDYWYEFLKNAVRYTMIRCEWETLDYSERGQKDAERTGKHNALITSVNILARIAEKEGIDNSWRTKLGEERKRIGDFACFVTYMTGISNR